MVEKNPRARKDKYLKTVIDKLDYIASHNNYVVIAGDLLHIPCNSTLLFYLLYVLFSKHRGKFHGIIGNHDVIGRNTNNLSKTTVGALNTTRAYTLHREEFTLGGVTFVPAEITTNVDNIPVDTNNSKVLIAHKFYEQKFNPDESLFYSDINRLNYNLVILGHDHKPYEDIFVGNSTVIRMGSLTRIDTQSYNKDRNICYYRITSDGTGDYEYSREVIPYKSIEEVYTEEAIRHLTVGKVEKEAVSFIQLGDAIARLTKSSTGTNSLNEVLHRIKTPQQYIDEIKWKHEMNNVQYT